MLNNDADHRCMIALVVFLRINKFRHDHTVSAVGHAFFRIYEKVTVKGCKKAVIAGYQLRGEIHASSEPKRFAADLQEIKNFPQKGGAKSRFCRHIVRGFFLITQNFNFLLRRPL